MIRFDKGTMPHACTAAKPADACRPAEALRSIDEQMAQAGSLQPIPILPTPLARHHPQHTVPQQTIDNNRLRTLEKLAAPDKASALAIEAVIEQMSRRRPEAALPPVTGIDAALATLAPYRGMTVQAGAVVPDALVRQQRRLKAHVFWRAGAVALSEASADRTGGGDGGSLFIVLQWQASLRGSDAPSEKEMALLRFFAGISAVLGMPAQVVLWIDHAATRRRLPSAKVQDGDARLAEQARALGMLVVAPASNALPARMAVRTRATRPGMLASKRAVLARHTGRVSEAMRLR